MVRDHFMLLLLLTALILLMAISGGSVGIERTSWAVMIGLVAGRWIQNQWIFPGKFRRAELLWDGGAPASEVTSSLRQATFATGELGYRIHLLLGRTYFAQGFRNQAGNDFLQAQLARLPTWKRMLVQPFFLSLPKVPSPMRFRYGRFLLRLASRIPHLHHRLGILHLRRNGPGDSDQAWLDFRNALPLSGDDPLMLEDILLAALNRGEPEIAAVKAYVEAQEHH